MVKENHILELELKQAVKKLKEDPRIEMMWEEQDQADQRKSVNKQDNLFFREETREADQRKSVNKQNNLCFREETRQSPF